MSRLFGIGIVFVNTATTIASAICNSATLLILIVSVLTSIMIGCISWMIGTMLVPTYFWDHSPTLIKIKDMSDTDDIRNQTKSY